MLFDTVFVINLDKDTEKMKRMDTTLRDLDIQYERVPGVNGKELSVEERTERSTKLCDTLCTNSTIGCASSHISVWKHVVKQRYSSALILEDDVVFTDDFKQVVEKAFKQLPDNWDIMYLGFLDAGYDALDYSEKVSPNLRIPKHCSGSHAYAVSARGAKKLCKLIPKATFHIDLVLSWNFKHLEVYTCYPLVAYQNDMASSNIGIKVPILLNKLTNFRVYAHKLDGRTLSWYMSEPGLKLFHEKLPVNLWFGIFFLLGYLDYKVALAIVAVDYLYSVSSHNNTSLDSYSFLLLAIALGVGLSGAL